MENLIGKDQSTWVDGQMQISYWCYQNISPENLNYILSLPMQIKLTYNDVSLHISHSSANFIADGEHKEWRTSRVAERYKDKFISQETFKKDIHNHFKNDKHFNEIFKALEDGIYIFGHSHIQWNYQSDNGKKVLINPGSCGLPLDCIETGVPYTILDISDMKNVIVEERRVPFDKNTYLDCFIKSEQFVKANVWSKIIEMELKTNREHLTFFLKYVEDYAVKIGDNQRPFSVPTWEKAFELWQKSNMLRT